MTDFLTVEDINTIDINTFVNEFYTLETKKISWQEFENVLYDFCIVSHSVNGSEHTFTIEVHNSLWCGRYYIGGSRYISSVDYDDATNTITVVTSFSDISLRLWLCNYLDFEFEGTWEYYPETPVIYIAKNEINSRKNYNCIRYDGETGFQGQMRCNTGVIDITDITYRGIVIQGNRTTKILCLLKKTDLVFNFNNTCFAGKINHIPLGVNRMYLPNGRMVDANPLNMEIVYGDIVLPVVYDENIGDYCFDLDLTDKLDTNSVKVSLKVTSNTYVNNGVFDITIPCEYVSVDNETDLRSQILSGIRVLELGADISLTSNISISNDLIIKGNGKRLTLNNHSIIINEGNKVIIENAELNIGNPAIIQKENTNLELTGVKFTNNNATDYNNLGSCIYCDVDLESLSVDSDFTTTIKDSTFINNHSAIFHGGQLTVDNCKYLNNDLTYVDKDNPAFLYQTDGDAEITNSIFDIDYQDNTLCENQINIGFAQALIRCGLTATINTATHESLQADNELPFFDSYRNQSHVFAKYYYPQIETCVFTSPVENKETESICYCVSGTDWVYKTNAVVTRADWQNENTINNIDWEGI